MSWFRKPLIFLLTVALGSSVLAAKKEDAAKKSEKADKKKDKKKDGDLPKGEAAPGAEGTMATDGKPKISVPVPPGHDAKGLVIPYRDADGKMQMRFTMEIGKRTDTDHMEMTKLLIETFDDEGKQEMKIDLPQSLLDLNTRVISTESGVVIDRADFQLSGQAMEFNTETKAGTIRGKVRMLIYNLDDETDTKPAAPAAAK